MLGRVIAAISSLLVNFVLFISLPSFLIINMSINKAVSGSFIPVFLKRFAIGSPLKRLVAINQPE
jgi:hypothetical protein